MAKRHFFLFLFLNQLLTGLPQELSSFSNLVSLRDSKNFNVKINSSHHLTTSRLQNIRGVATPWFYYTGEPQLPAVDVHYLCSLWRSTERKISFMCPFKPCTFANNTKIFETNIPRKGIARPQSQISHSYVCERFIYSHNQSSYSAAGICGMILGLYKSLTDTWMWKWEPRQRHSFSGNT